jgi:hypothetical protein
MRAFLLPFARLIVEANVLPALAAHAKILRPAR